jgi:hypothetical protein
VKADANHDWGGDEGSELRAALRGWHVPPPPTEIEDALRREFRGRRVRRRPAAWLSLAAAVVLLAAWQIVSARLAGRPSIARVAAPGVAAIAMPSPPLGLSLPEPEARRGAPVHTTARRTARVAAVPKTVAPVVVVEPAQAELLTEFGRRAWEKEEAAPGASLPRMPAAEAPAYRAEWQEVAGEWPAVQVAVPKSER